MQRKLLFLAIMVFTSCASMQLVEVQNVDTLYFGTDVDQKPFVTDDDWRAFVNEYVEPAFENFSQWTVNGHFEGDDELTHVVLLVNPPRRATDEQIIKIIREYKRRFNQKSVLWVRGQGLVAPE